MNKAQTDRLERATIAFRSDLKKHWVGTLDDLETELGQWSPAELSRYLRTYVERGDRWLGCLCSELERMGDHVWRISPESLGHPDSEGYPFVLPKRLQRAGELLQEFRDSLTLPWMGSYNDLFFDSGMDGKTGPKLLRQVLRILATIPWSGVLRRDRKRWRIIPNGWV